MFELRDYVKLLLAESSNPFLEPSENYRIEIDKIAEDILGVSKNQSVVVQCMSVFLAELRNENSNIRKKIQQKFPDEILYWGFTNVANSQNKLHDKSWVSVATDIMLKELVVSALPYPDHKNSSEFLDELFGVFRKMADDVIKDIATKETKNVPPEVDDPKKGKLGKFAFPAQRSRDLAAGRVLLEPDTALETRLLDALQSHFKGLKKLDTGTMQIMRNMLANGMYTSMFSAPTESTVYRGIACSEKWLRNIIKAKPEKNGTFKGNIVYKPSGRAESSSWSISPTVASDFAKENTAPRAPYIVTLFASTADNVGNFLACEDALYKLDFAKEFKDEREVLGISSHIKVHTIDWTLWVGR